MKLHDDIHNYYEKLALDEIEFRQLSAQFDAETLADICCIVLNKLPTRYIRYEVDMAFYLPQHERIEMMSLVKQAVDEAVQLINNHTSAKGER